MLSVLFRVIDFYQILIVVWAIFSWFPISNEGLFADIRNVISRLVQPYVGLFQRVIPPLGGIDFSPVVAIVALNLVQRGIVALF
ncbi:MAG: YggT family protein [Atopobiaceae bacterium]|nr:YggT family protein [Atopobiaceae bacterium]